MSCKFDSRFNSSDDTNLYVAMPDGRYEKATPVLVIDGADIRPIVFPVVSPVRAIQMAYEKSRLDGYSHDESFSFAAYRAARKLGPFEDGDTLGFVRLNPYINKVSSNFDVQVSYWKMRKNGQSHNMAEMLATRSFPGVKTDAVFNEGKFSGDTGRIGPQELWRIQQAEAAGVSTTGKWYCSGLAEFPGDPTAWVSDRGDVLRVAREKNMTVHGYVEHQGHEADGGSDVAIADELINDEVNDILESCPGADAEAVREQVYSVRTGAVDTNPLHCQDYFSTDIP